MSSSSLGEAALQLLVARPQHHQLRAAAQQQRQRRKQEVHAFLPCEAADHAYQQGVRLAVEPEACLQHGLVGSACGEIGGSESRCEMCVRRGIPQRVVDAVEDAGQHGSAPIEHVAQPHAAFVGEDLRGIGRRHRGNAIGQRNASFEKTDPSVGFHAVVRERMRRQSQ